MTATENRERFELWATVRKDARRVIEREALQHGYASALAWAAYDAANLSYIAAGAHQACDYMADTYANTMAEDAAADIDSGKVTVTDQKLENFGAGDRSRRTTPARMAEEDAAAPAGNREAVAFDKHGKAVAWRIDPDEESEPAAPAMP